MKAGLLVEAHIAMSIYMCIYSFIIGNAYGIYLLYTNYFSWI